MCPRICSPNEKERRLVLKKLKEQLKVSEEYARKYLKTKSTNVIRELLKKNPYFIKEQWVHEVIAEWYLRGRKDSPKVYSLKILIPGRGKRTILTRRDSDEEGRKFIHEVDELVKRKGVTKTEAFEERLKAVRYGLGAIKMKDHRARKRDLIYYVENSKNYYTMHCGLRYYNIEPPDTVDGVIICETKTIIKK